MLLLAQHRLCQCFNVNERMFQKQRRASFVTMRVQKSPAGDSIVGIGKTVMGLNFFNSCWGGGIVRLKL